MYVFYKVKKNGQIIINKGMWSTISLIVQETYTAVLGCVQY